MTDPQAPDPQAPDPQAPDPQATGRRRRRAQQTPPTRRAAAHLQHLPFWVGVTLGAVIALVAAGVVVVVRGQDGPEPGNYELVIVSGLDESIGGQRQALVDEWNALHDTMKARIMVLPRESDAQHSQMLAQAQSGDPGVDIFNLDVTWTAEFAHFGYIEPLDPSRVPTDGFLAGPLSTCSYDGKLWALPFNADVGLLYYRPDLLNGAAPPGDWDALAAQAHALARPPMAGYLGQTADYEGLTVTALEMIWGAGGTVVDDDGHVLPDKHDVDAVTTGLDRLRSLDPTLSRPPGRHEEETRSAFRAGQALFMRNWPVSYRALGQTADGPSVPFDVAPLPSGSAALGGQNLAVSSRSAHPQAARALVEFLTGERSEQLLFERGGLPATRTSVYHDPVVNKIYPFAPKLLTAFDHAHRRPTVPHYIQFSQAFRQDVLTYLGGSTPLDETGLRADLEAALQGRWPR